MAPRLLALAALLLLAGAAHAGGALRARLPAAVGHCQAAADRPAPPPASPLAAAGNRRLLDAKASALATALASGNASAAAQALASASGNSTATASEWRQPDSCSLGRRKPASCLPLRAALPF